jgi:hypothetical protein
MTIVIAIYAAFISTVALLWQIYTWGKNRYRLSLTVGRQQVYPNGIDSSPSEKIVFRIVNIGREPTTLLSFGFECDRRRISENPTPITYEAYDGVGGKGKPIVLHQGEWHEYRLQASALDVGRLRAWAKDTKGNVFTSAWLDEEGKRV